MASPQKPAPAPGAAATAAVYRAGETTMGGVAKVCHTGLTARRAECRSQDMY